MGIYFYATSACASNLAYLCTCMNPMFQPSRPIGDRVKSKFKKFKNLFSETDKSPSFDPKSPNQGSTKRKLTIVSIFIFVQYQVC